MTTTPIDLGNFAIEADGLELALTGGKLITGGVKGTVTAIYKGQRCGQDYLLIAGRDRRRRLAADIAGATGLSLAAVEGKLLELADLAEKALAFTASASEETALTEEDEHEALTLLDDSDLWTHINDAIGSLGIAGEEEARLLVYLTLTSRLLPKPISAAIKGPSAAGKSYVIQGVLKLFPREAYYELTSASERALIYTEADFRHRILVILEVHENEFLDMLVRTLLSEGHIIYETVIDMETVRKEKEGPTGLLTTTTKATLHEENETRVLSIFIRDDPVQTRAVMGLTAGLFSINGAKPELDLTPLINIQRWLQQSGEHDVVVPFADALVRLLPDKPVRWRRDVTQILTAIQSCALLHQRQRERDPEGRVIASLDDYEMVRPLLAVALAPSLADSLTDPQREAVKSVRRLCEGSTEPVTISAVGRDLNIDRSSASVRIRSALEGGYIINNETFTNRPAKLRPGKETMPPPLQLPSLQGVKEALSAPLLEKRPHATTPPICSDTDYDSTPDPTRGVTPAPSNADSTPNPTPDSLSGSDIRQPSGVEAWSRFREGDETEAADRARRLRARALWEKMGRPTNLSLGPGRKIVNVEKFIAMANPDDLAALIAEQEKTS